MSPLQFITGTRRKSQGRESSPGLFLLSVEVTQEKSKQQHTSKNRTGTHATADGDRTLRLAQVEAVTNHWELGAGAEVGLIEMNFMVKRTGGDAGT